jgi:glucose/arabinose dehydrogenase
MVPLTGDLILRQVILFVLFHYKNGKPTGEWEIFADGFAGVDPIVNVRDAVARPMGLAVGPDGHLYINGIK